MELGRAYDSALAREKFGISLSREESLSFLRMIGIEAASTMHNFEFLRAVLHGILTRIPFHNLSLLTRGRRSPTPEEIRQDMLTGLGGPCGHMNPFLGALLDRIGFQVGLVPGSMTQPNCHLGVLVTIGGQRYYCDCGDGRPYFEPMPVDKPAEYLEVSHRWKTYPLEGNQLALDYLDETGNWRRNNTIDLTARPFNFFSRFIYSHYTQEDYGPFQRGFRLVFYPNRQILGIRDLVFLHEEGGSFLRSPIASSEAFFQQILSYFPVDQHLVRSALQELAERGIEPFTSFLSAKTNRKIIVT